ncbi:GGDEF domain-containing protein [Desulfosarcina alkanivorans]|uniref:diguanylate cyclase n=1 Tax=Desulfosarcina alkanivorans TaxID=571177 RepID=A0A5K7YEP0_9BACT|nr:GGDEF domain-containing protein [Desulfosarcina alkanivorans]BBO67486.1 GGDEF domain-containing protein [Desulfosarcina alkanivorans]
MKLFGKANPADVDPATLEKEIADTRERLNVFLESIRALFLFVREYTLDITEINADGFKKQLETLQEKFQADEKTKTIATQFDRQKGKILDHIQRQKTYIGERETEFREIIDLMTAAMGGLDNDNRDFYSSIRTQGERFEEITLLDDIKRIKSELVREVDNMRTMVREKEDLDQKTLDALSSQVDVLKKELDKARHTASTDGLTGVNNRKALDDHLRRLVERNTVTRAPFSLLMMDLDDFKQLNDTYGHTVGDRMLMAFTEKCRAAVRSDDFLARYGGEEFTLILPGASLRNASKKAKQLCRSIAAAKYAADDSPRAEVVTVTVSIGVSTYRKGDTVKSLVERADQCLYNAKAAGKNRVVAENAL